MTMEASRLSHEELLTICQEAGADDAGFVELDRPALEAQSPGLRGYFPRAVTVVVLALALNRDSLRSLARNLCSYECNGVLDEFGPLARGILKRLAARGVRGLALPPVFPMDFSRPPSPPMVPSHKVLAQEAGLGVMGLSRLLLHPRLGSAVYLSSLLLDCALDRYSQPLSESPCVSCKLCVAACPVGAIGAPGGFDHRACANHNYRELAPGFMHWVEALVSSPDLASYRSRYNDLESLSWWQSLTYKPGYKCNHCLAVCPAGQESLPGYRDDPKGFVRQVVGPLKDRPETVYVQAGSRAEEAARANPAKRVRLVGPA
jgi:epoxyqueuosine reductase QueG